MLCMSDASKDIDDDGDDDIGREGGRERDVTPRVNQVALELSSLVSQQTLFPSTYYI